MSTSDRRRGSAAVVPRPRNPDPVRRSAARTATLVAVPIALLIAIGSIWLSGGFGRPTAAPTPSATPTIKASAVVSLPATALSDATANVCRTVIARLPATLRGQERRQVSGPEQNAAYGEPPVTVACGVAALTLAPTDFVVQLSGVCWMAKQTGPTTTWMTVDRAVPLSVSVPGDQAGTGQTVVGLSPAIRDNDAVAATYPNGCTN